MATTANTLAVIFKDMWHVFFRTICHRHDRSESASPKREGCGRQVDRHLVPDPWRIHPLNEPLPEKDIDSLGPPTSTESAMSAWKQRRGRITFRVLEPPAEMRCALRSPRHTVYGRNTSIMLVSSRSGPSSLLAVLAVVLAAWPVSSARAGESPAARPLPGAHVFGKLRFNSPGTIAVAGG